MSENGESIALAVFTDPQTQGQAMHVAPGDVIYAPDTPADSVFYIQRGEVRLYTQSDDGASRLIEIMGPGQWFGASAVAGLSVHQIKAVAVSRSQLIRVPVVNLMASLSRDPAQYGEFAKQLALKLMVTTQEASRLVFEDCQRRLINVLLRFSSSAAASQREDGVVLRITHEQLAQAVGVARETVSLALTQLREKNLLRTGRNQLIFKPEVLRQLLDSLAAPAGTAVGNFA
jgi:CRP-like cAMP-binding protein